jgi:crotonobetainyl-CoA:carnitine CoA-transferase CaiB-like acyl-CoA transferase
MSVLRGFRVLAVEQYGAGPFGTGYLAALGAEVIKVEAKAGGGDVSRGVGPFFDDGQPETNRSLFFQSLNAGKKSITLDLGTKAGRGVLRRLAASSHALVSNLRGDVPAKLGLTYAQMKDANASLVCGHLTGYGRTGERAHWPGYDYLMQAEAGYFSLTGEPGSPPARMGLSVVDYMSGVVLALGVVSGILDAQRTGEGCDVDVSLYDVALHNLNYLASWYLNAGAGTTRQPRSAHPSLTPCQLYRTRDGWIYLMCNKEKFWPALCERIGRPQWAQDPRFLTFKQRFQHRDLLTEMLDDVLSTRGTAEWMAAFGGAVPASPVLTVPQALDAPFAAATGRIETVAAAEGPAVRQVRNPLRVSKHDGSDPAAAPELGEHTDQVLRDAGFSAGEIQQLRQEGVL